MRHLLRQVAPVFLITLMVLGLSQSAFAQESTQDDFKELTTKAQGLFEEEKYEDAAAAFLQAYEIKPVSNILYNVARIYEKAGNIDKAVQYYEEFVKSPNVEHGPRQDAMERIKILREVQALDEKPTEEPKPEESVEPAPAPAEADYTFAYIFWGTGGAALIGSGVFALLASGAHADFEDATDLEDRRDYADSGKTYSIVADSLLVTGAVLGTIGTVLFFTAGPDESDTGGLAVTPIIGADRVGMGLTFGF